MGGNISLFTALSYRHSGTNQITPDFNVELPSTTGLCLPLYTDHPIPHLH